MTDRPPKPPRPSRPEHDLANDAIARYHARTHGERVAGGAENAALARALHEFIQETREAFGGVQRHMERIDRSNADQNAAHALVAREFGFADRLPESIKGSLPPPPLEEKKRPPPLVPGIREDTSKTRRATYLALAIVVFEFLDHVVTFVSKHL